MKNLNLSPFKTFCIALSALSSLSILSISCAASHTPIRRSMNSMDLVGVYQMALKNDPGLMAAQANYLAAKENSPIARAGLLPSINITGNISENKINNGSQYRTEGYTLTLTQPIFNPASWAELGQANISIKQAALKLEQAKQNLVMSVATDYFEILEAQDKYQYAQKYLEQLKARLKQTTQMYKVGLKAYTDVQTTKASYESAVADVSQAQNNIQNAYAQLESLTGQPIQSIMPLKSKFPLLKPNPENSNQWTQTAQKWNLNLQASELQKQFDQKTIDINRAGTASVPGLYPTVGLTLSRSQAIDNGTPYSNITTDSASLSAQYNIFSGGATYANIKQAEDIVNSDQANLNQTKRLVISNTQQYYLNVLSDISQIHALSQAVISGKASLKASRAAYEVGTRTIVDLLRQESLLYKSQQAYADAIYGYITDSLALKKSAGLLSVKDLQGVNQWLKR